MTATDPDCGLNSVVSYSIGEKADIGNKFSIKPASGELCLENELDYEKQTSYDFTVVATDKVRGEIGSKNVYTNGKLITLLTI